MGEHAAHPDNPRVAAGWLLRVVGKRAKVREVPVPGALGPCQAAGGTPTEHVRMRGPHRDSVRWHRLGPQKAVSMTPVSTSLARTPCRPRCR